MFVYDGKEKVGVVEERTESLKGLALITIDLDEMKELLKVKNPFINRELAKNTNISPEIMHILVDEYPAYTMLINLAKNPCIDQDIIDKLYVISDGIYKDSLFRSDLDSIFSRAS